MDNPQNETNQACCSTPQTPRPPFNQCGIEEKVSRLHQELVDTRRGLNWAYQNNSQLRRKIESLEKHQHLPSGECVIKITDFRNGEDTCGQSQAFDLLT